VHERARVVGRELLRELHRLVDHDRGGHLVVEHQLPHRQTQDARSTAGIRSSFQSRACVTICSSISSRLSMTPSTISRAYSRRLASRLVRRALRLRGEGHRELIAADVGLEEDVEGALARLGPSLIASKTGRQLTRPR
jgi:hypothetical protein